MSKNIKEHIIKLGNGKYRLLSHKGKNLGTFDSHAAAAKHEGEVEYFKHHEELEEPGVHSSGIPENKSAVKEEDPLQNHLDLPEKRKSFKEFDGDIADVHNSDQESDSDITED